MTRMADMPPWHVGHVLKKLMLARDPEMTRQELAARSGKRPMTITNLLKGGTYEDETLTAVCVVLDVTKAELYAEVDRSNAARSSNVIPLPSGELRRRTSDRDPFEIEADQYARRLLRLSNSAQTALYNAIRAFEEAFGLLKSGNDR